MGTLAGFMVGYMAGVKAGPQGLEELRKAWQVIVDSEEFKGLLAMGGDFLQNLSAQGRAAAVGQVDALTAKDGHLREQALGNGEILETWRRLSSSEEFQALVSGGMAVLGGVLEQGSALLAEHFSKGQDQGAHR